MSAKAAIHFSFFIKHNPASIDLRAALTAPRRHLAGSYGSCAAEFRRR
jgi:hypothetical protein